MQQQIKKILWAFECPQDSITQNWTHYDKNASILYFINKLCRYINVQHCSEGGKSSIFIVSNIEGWVILMVSIMQRWK
jgi:hypothetical protein